MKMYEYTESRIAYTPNYETLIIRKYQRLDIKAFLYTFKSLNDKLIITKLKMNEQTKKNIFILCNQGCYPQQVKIFAHHSK